MRPRSGRGVRGPAGDFPRRSPVATECQKMYNRVRWRCIRYTDEHQLAPQSRGWNPSCRRKAADAQKGVARGDSGCMACVSLFAVWAGCNLNNNNNGGPRARNLNNTVTNNRWNSASRISAIPIKPRLAPGFVLKRHRETARTEGSSRSWLRKQPPKYIEPAPMIRQLSAVEGA